MKHRGCWWLIFVLCLCSCGGGGASGAGNTAGNSNNGNTTNANNGTPQSTITSVTVAPTTANLQTGQSQQFSANVNGSASTAVTWAVVGDAAISGTGLFTAGSTAGTVTVTASSVVNPSMKASATISVSLPIVSFGKWSGTIQSSGTVNNVFPLDFSANLIGTSLSTTGHYQPMSISPPLTSCTTTDMQSVGSAIDKNFWTFPSGPYAGLTLNGSVSSGIVSMTIQTPSPLYLPETLSLTGSLTLNGTSISGTYQNTGYQAGCLYSGSYGTFSFTQYSLLNGTYSGTFDYGTIKGVPLSMTFSEDASGNLNSTVFVIGAIPSLCGSPTTITMTGTTDGRFFYTSRDNVTKPGIAVWGLMNDTGGKSVTIYSKALGQVEPCTDSFSTSNPSGGIVLTKP